MRFWLSSFCILFWLTLGVIAPASGFQSEQNTDRSSDPIIDYVSAFHPVYGEKGMVVAQEYHGAEAGKEILALGGNAVDAAVATGFALAVTHPQAGNLGGGGFMLIYLPDEKRTVAIDYREMAPSKATRSMFLDQNGDVDPMKARFSQSSSGVPGTVAGLLHALDTYGSLPRDVVMAPAIRLAEDGFRLSWGLADSLNRYRRRFIGDEAAEAYFTRPDGFKVGDLWQQKDLAQTLRIIAKEGRAGFYEGDIADKIVSAVTSGDGLISHQDLKGYRVVERPAITGEFRGYNVVTMPPPSSGGVHIIQMLNVLSQFDLKAMGSGSAAYIHALTETMKYAYADRSEYLGDPDYVNVPIKGLTDPAYGKAIAARINPDRAVPSSDIAPAPELPYESNETTHFSSADMNGMVVANTYTLNFSYGNGKAVAGAGFLMNNEMDDFSAKPGTANAYGLLGGEANAIEPGKRPLSSMTPVLVFKDGQPFFVSGSPGGSTIITAVMQTILNVMVFDMNAMAATTTPRIHHQWYPDVLMMEPGHSPDTLRLLRQKGHVVPGVGRNTRYRVLGATQSIMLRDGKFFGGPDPRRPGSHAATPN